jgi:hypothetical protein
MASHNRKILALHNNSLAPVKGWLNMDASEQALLVIEPAELIIHAFKNLCPKASASLPAAVSKVVEGCSKAHLTGNAKNKGR